MTWVTTTAFYNFTGVDSAIIGSSVVEESLQQAENSIKRKLFIDRQEIYGAATSYIVLNGYDRIADVDGDGVVTTTDITMFELDREQGTRINRSLNITSFDNQTGLLQLDAEYPTTEPELVIEYKECREYFTDMLPTLKRMERMEATNTLFENVPVSTLEQGISSWNLNGVSVTFDLSAMQQVIEQNNKTLKQLYSEMRPFNTGRSIKPGQISKEIISRRKRNRVQSIYGGGGFRVW